MFARIKKSGKKYQYLQIVENRKEKGKVKQRVIATLGRIDQMQAKGRVETLIRSLSRVGAGRASSVREEISASKRNLCRPADIMDTEKRELFDPRRRSPLRSHS